MNRDYTPRLSAPCERGSHDDCAYRWKVEEAWYVCTCSQHRKVHPRRQGPGYQALKDKLTRRIEDG